MGWFQEDAPGHEGYVIGAVPVVDERGRERPGFWRVLTRDERGMSSQLQAECECGWRSPRVHVYPPVEWNGIMMCSTSQSDRMAEYWSEHIELELLRERGLGIGPQGFLAELLRRTIDLADRLPLDLGPERRRPR